MNALVEVLDAKARRLIYTIYAAVSAIATATQVGFVAADAGQPTWLTVTLAVLAFVGAPLGLTAAANTPSVERRTHENTHVL